MLPEQLLSMFIPSARRLLADVQPKGLYAAALPTTEVCQDE